MRLLVSLTVLLLLLVAAPVQGASVGEALAAYGRGDYAASVAILGPLARAGDAEARFLLGSQYARGEGVERNEIRAYAWLSLAANQGLRVALRLRDELASSMNQLQIEQAEALARALDAGRTDSGEEAPTGASHGQVAAQGAAMTVTAIQRDLHRLGYRPGPADGLIGPQLRAAVARFQADAGLLPIDGEPTSELAARLREAVEGSLIARIQTTLGARGYRAGAVDGVIGPKTRAALVAYRRDAGAEGVVGFDRLVARLATETDATGERTATSNGCDEARAMEFLVALEEDVTPPPDVLRVVTPEEFLAWWRRCRDDRVQVPAVP